MLPITVPIRQRDGKEKENTYVTKYKNVVAAAVIVAVLCSLPGATARPAATLLPPGPFSFGADNAHRENNRHGQRVLRRAGVVGAHGWDIALRTL